MSTPRHTAFSSDKSHSTYSTVVKTNRLSVYTVIKQNITDIRRYLEENIRDKGEVEKAVKATLLETIRLYHNFTGEVPIRTWLFNIACQILENGSRRNAKITANQNKMS
ncbi:hypothetical protein [Agarilytica rhodophyticola]|uniref:hypothetical protein n=1 Tax=Agarilytica rhodophyticola TaxID=1737490 RepID=UPI000B3465E4|nr:hypothetical protein [Agarilytica rhodophyticola]